VRLAILSEESSLDTRILVSWEVLLAADVQFSDGHLVHGRVVGGVGSFFFSSIIIPAVLRDDIQRVHVHSVRYFGFH